MYEVEYSPYFREAIREFARRNPSHTAELLAALREFERRFRIYPQFGQPLRDLAVKPLQLWIGVVPPLVLHYTLDESQRLVMVMRLPLPLPRTGII